jgi:hypothetical protein
MAPGNGSGSGRSRRRATASSARPTSSAPGRSDGSARPIEARIGMSGPMASGMGTALSMRQSSVLSADSRVSGTTPVTASMSTSPRA